MAFFPDGRVQLYKVSVSWGPPIKYMVTALSGTSVADLTCSGDVIWNDCAILFEGVDTKSSIGFIAGG